MKKVLSVLLTLAMIFAFMAPATAAYTPAPGYAAYEKAKVSGGEVADLSYDQIASLILDWVDRQIASATEDFGSFNVQISEDTEIPVDLEIKSLNDILKYKDYLQALGGDFANLNTASLPESREAGDGNFIFSMLQFMADNAKIFGKVFSWEPGQTFDFGKVGEYITGLEDGNAIKDFYNNYLIGNDIQEKFVSEIAREMGYTVKEDEPFDDVINNGILEWFTGLCKSNGIISEDLAAKMLSTYNLKTTDIYTLIKTFVADVQADNEVKINTYYTYFLDNVVRPMLKAMFGYAPTVGESAGNAEQLKAEFAKTYSDLKTLNAISGGTVDYQAADKNDYRFTITDDAVTGVQTINWGESLINLEPPTVTISDDGTFTKDYHPTSTDPESYLPKVYTDAKYQEYLTAAELNDLVSCDPLPEEYAAIIADGNGTNLEGAFNFKVAQGEETREELKVTFEELEQFANDTLEQSRPKLQETVDTFLESAISGLPIQNITATATINSIKVALSYVGYGTDDEFVVQVTAVPQIDITYGGNAWSLASMIGLTEEKIEAQFIQPAIDQVVTNPIATIVVDNLSGSIDGLDSVNALLNFVDTDFVIDESVLDFAANYETYNGVVGQANRVLCDLLKMLLSDSGYESLALTEGGNQNLTANLEKLCAKVDNMFSVVKKFMSEEDFASFAEELDIGSAFMSDHGFNAGMIYNLDFSSVENLYVCAIRIGCDMFDGSEGILHDIHEIVENLDTLDAMAIGLMNYVMPKALAKASESLNGFTYTYTEANVNGDAKDEIMGKLVDIAYTASVWGVDFLNETINNTIGKLFEGTDFVGPEVAFELGVEKQSTWQATLDALVNRFLELTKGIIICVETIDPEMETLDKISTVANAILPLGSMFSNCASETFTCDLSEILNTYLFTEALDGNFDHFLGLFETKVKTNDVAADKSVTKALIHASEYIVDSIFPDTVQYELYKDYEQPEKVQEYFTSSANDAVIAENNMISINSRKADLVPAAFDLMREANMLPYFTKCPNNKHVALVERPEEKSTCQKRGHSAYQECTECGEKIGYEEYELADHVYSEFVKTVEPTCTAAGYSVYKCANCEATQQRDTKPATGHKYSEWKVVTEATCTEAGSEQRVCNACDNVETKSIPAKGHTDADGDKVCDDCGETLGKLTFFEKVRNFFQSIINWFRNLFKR